jgi:hypothetical protein
VAFVHLRLGAGEIVAEIDLSGAELIKRRIDVDEAPPRVFQRIVGMGKVGAKLVDPGSEAVDALRDRGGATTGLLIDNLDRIICPDDIATQLVHFATHAIDVVAQAMGDRTRAVAHGGEMLHRGHDLTIALAVLVGVIDLPAGLLQQVGHVGLQRPDWPGAVIQSLLKILNELTRAILIERTCLGGLLGLFFGFLQRDVQLRDRGFLLFDRRLVRLLPETDLPQRQPQLVQLVVDGLRLRLRATALVLTAVGLGTGSSDLLRYFIVLHEAVRRQVLHGRFLLAKGWTTWWLLSR